MDLEKAIAKLAAEQEAKAKLAAEAEALKEKLEIESKAKTEITERANKYKNDAQEWAKYQEETKKAKEAEMLKTYGDKAADAKELLDKGLSTEQVSKLLDIKEETPVVPPTNAGGKPPAQTKDIKDYDFNKVIT